MEAFPIGRAARATGTKVQTVRYYEQIGLLPPPDRTEGNQRLYTGADIARLGFIRHARRLGFSIQEIRELLQMSDRPDMRCEEVDAIAARHLEELRTRIGQMLALQAELERMVGRCANGVVADCRVIEALSDGA